MLGCNHPSRAKPLREPIADDLNSIATLLNEDRSAK
jgi:hypothetical protein